MSQIDVPSQNKDNYNRRVNWKKNYLFGKVEFDILCQFLVTANFSYVWLSTIGWLIYANFHPEIDGNRVQLL